MCKVTKSICFELFEIVGHDLASNFLVAKLGKSKCNEIVVIFFMFLKLIFFFCILYKINNNDNKHYKQMHSERERESSPGSISCVLGDQSVQPYVNNLSLTNEVGG
jgi:hypothetical protein